LILKWLWRAAAACIGLVIAAASGAAIAGALGLFWTPLDIFNHVQLLLLPVTLAGLILALVAFRRQPLRGMLIALAATGFLASVTVTMPEFVAAFTAPPAAAPPGPTIRLMSFNIYANNRHLSQVMDPVIAADPDILLIQEYWRDFRPLLDAPLDERYPYSVRCQGDRRAFIALFSRLPFTIAPGHDCVDDIARGGRVARISVAMSDGDGKPFTVMTTHLDWPMPPARQRLQFAQLSQAVAAVSGPLIVAGDFNSTPFSGALRTFVAENGLVRHTRLMPTWPAAYLGTGVIDVPRFLPLDHVLSRGEIEISHIAVGESPGGSDHLPVIVDFWLP
jgi:endonuclease/exonuclease/phosphatase (EEP) superfamily protein YafD